MYTEPTNDLMMIWRLTEIAYAKFLYNTEFVSVNVFVLGYSFLLLSLQNFYLGPSELKCEAAKSLSL